MSLQVQTSKIEPDIIVVHLSGSITLWPETPLDELFISNLLEQNEKKLIFDLSGVRHMDSSGVQLMFDCFSAMRKAGGRLHLTGANPRMARLFQITQLDTILPFFPTIAAACEGFNAPSRAIG